MPASVPITVFSLLTFNEAVSKVTDTASFKQIKQNFPLRYFYGESANTIKIQVWVTLIANLLITLLQKGVSRSWSFSGLATIVRIMLMYYIDVQGFLEHPEKDWEEALAAMLESPPDADNTGF